MTTHYKWIDNRKFYYTGTYNTWTRALQKAKQKRKQNNSRYYICKNGSILARSYDLYLTKP